MRKTNKNIFISGFYDPTPISPLPSILLLDLKSDGDYKLILFNRSTSSLLIYKGISLDFEKQIELKNISHILSFYDEDSRTPQPCIVLGAQNAIYIYRNVKQSFRLKIPDLLPDPEQQLAWYEYSTDHQQLNTTLLKISNTKRLSQNGKYFIGSSTKERKEELIKSTFELGIINKDSISCLGTIKQKETVISIQNIVICTELKQLYILDNFGHIIVKSFDLGFVACEVFGEGDFPQGKYVVVALGREENVVKIENGEITERWKLTSKIKSSTMDYPLLYVLTTNHNIICYDIATDRHLKKYSFMAWDEAFQCECIRTRSFKALIVGGKYEIRVYNETLLISKLELNYELRCFKFGTTARQENCLVLVYKDNGFEVKIMHRQWNPNVKYQKQPATENKEDKFPLPPITSVFASEMSPQDPTTTTTTTTTTYKEFQKNMKILKWRLLNSQLTTHLTPSKISINTNVIGIGPNFILKITLENITEDTLYNVRICISFDPMSYQVKEYETEVGMLVPNFQYEVEVRMRYVGEKGKAEAERVHLTVAGEEGEQVSICVPMPQSEIA